MIYFKWIDETGEYNEGISSVTYYELIDEYVLRQLMLIEDRWVGSNRKDKEFEYYLAEGKVTLKEINSFDGDISMISKDEFEELWEVHCSAHLELWKKSKEDYTVGMQLQGSIEVIYPQGMLIKVGKYTLALGDYEACVQKSSCKSLYPNQLISGKVKGYDEVNMWILLEECKIVD
ncbi:MAG: hypothetical protein N4A64_10785 [Marinisporobacter sp.]|jgi:hypothetical protein|nr:hypothetical protein [Marinisporobacter sp.]